MNPLVVLSAVVASAAAAPSYYGAPIATAPIAAGYAGYAGYGHPAVAIAAPAVAIAAPAISVPAPYTTQAVQGAPAVSVHQPAPQITKQLHYADRTYVAGYDTSVLKPAIPDFRIAVPTALKATQQINPAEVTVQKETHVVNEPYTVEQPYNVPYDVIKRVEKIVEVPTAVHVSKPYAVPQPYPVRGEDIVHVTRTAPVVKHTNIGAVGYGAVGYGAGYGAVGYGAHPVAAYGAAPAIAKHY